MMIKYLKFLFSVLFVSLCLIFPASADNVDEAQTCGIKNMQEMYMKDGNVDKYCWYCKVVIILTNAYLKAAQKSMSITIDLAKLILKLCFMVWLAYYILQQVSSFAPVEIGKMLQEILTMMFKVALAWLVINQGIGVIRELILDPIMGTGVDYGTSILTPLLDFSVETSGAD